MYENWKILKSEFNEKQDEYAAVADWCNKSEEYHIEADDKYYFVAKNHVPIYEEIKQMRANAYAQEVDCITSHIQRLRDQSPVPEGEINELIAEREAKVKEIQKRYPYNNLKEE